MSNSFREILYSLASSLVIVFITYITFFRNSDIEEQMKVRLVLIGFSITTLVFYSIFSFTVLKCDSVDTLVKEFPTDIFSIDNDHDILLNNSDDNVVFVLGYDNENDDNIVYYFNVKGEGSDFKITSVSGEYVDLNITSDCEPSFINKVVYDVYNYNPTLLGKFLGFNEEKDEVVSSKTVKSVLNVPSNYILEFYTK